MEGMQFLCGAPIAIVALAIWTSMYSAKRISGRLYWSALVCAGSVGLILVSWVFYYGFVIEGLVMAAKDGDTQKVQALLRWGANPNAYADELGYPLQAAVENDRTEVVRILLGHGAKPGLVNTDLGPDKRSLVQVAAGNKDWEMVRLLKSAGG